MLFALAAPFVLSDVTPLSAPAALPCCSIRIARTCDCRAGGREVCTRCAQGERAETDIRAHLEEEGWMAGCSCMVGDGARGISRDAERAHRPPSHLLSFRCASEGGGGRQLGRRAAMHALWLTCACLPAMPGNVLLRWQYICCTKGLLRLRESELVRFPRPRPRPVSLELTSSSPLFLQSISSIILLSSATFRPRPVLRTS